MIPPQTIRNLGVVSRMVPAVKISCRSGTVLGPRNKGILARAEERGTPPSSNREGRIYRLAVPVPK